MSAKLQSSNNICLYIHIMYILYICIVRNVPAFGHIDVTLFSVYLHTKDMLIGKVVYIVAPSNNLRPGFE